MIIVREIFIAKPGMASKLATKFKEEMAGESSGNGFKVLTDVVGSYNTVVIESEYPDLTAFDKEMKEFSSKPRPKPDPSKPSHTDMYVEGRREILRVW
ncbi:MAG TPA: hypothetical protein VFB89_00520 [Gemmatimonadales bacterium]|nr:hypothetical protein [Gemmatimonadales bacterium]